MRDRIWCSIGIGVHPQNRSSGDAGNAGRALELNILRTGAAMHNEVAVARVTSVY
jgi:hypothetical protein